MAISETKAINKQPVSWPISGTLTISCNVLKKATERAKDQKEICNIWSVEAGRTTNYVVDIISTTRRRRSAGRWQRAERQRLSHWSSATERLRSVTPASAAPAHARLMPVSLTCRQCRAAVASLAPAAAAMSHCHRRNLAPVSCLATSAADLHLDTPQHMLHQLQRLYIKICTAPWTPKTRRCLPHQIQWPFSTRYKFLNSSTKIQEQQMPALKIVLHLWRPWMPLFAVLTNSLLFEKKTILWQRTATGNHPGKYVIPETVSIQSRHSAV